MEECRKSGMYAGCLRELYSVHRRDEQNADCKKVAGYPCRQCVDARLKWNWISELGIRGTKKDVSDLTSQIPVIAPYSFCGVRIFSVQ